MGVKIYIRKLLNKTRWIYYIFASFIVKRAKIDFENHKSFIINIDNAHEYFRMATFKTKEPEMIEWINSWEIAHGDVFFDIGANIGIYSLYASTIHSELNVYSFEPDVFSFPKLVKNLQTNALIKCKPMCVALSDSGSLAQFFCGLTTPGAGAGSLGVPYPGFGRDGSASYLILSQSLDELASKYQIPIPKYMKIDVDGHEHAILKGAASMLKNEKLRSVMLEIEVFDGSTEVIDLMKGYGFSVAEISKWAEYLVSGGVVRNYLFVRDSVA